MAAVIVPVWVHPSTVERCNYQHIHCGASCTPCQFHDLSGGSSKSCWAKWRSSATSSRQLDNASGTASTSRNTEHAKQPATSVAAFSAEPVATATDGSAEAADIHGTQEVGPSLRPLLKEWTSEYGNVLQQHMQASLEQEYQGIAASGELHKLPRWSTRSLEWPQALKAQGPGVDHNFCFTWRRLELYIQSWPCRSTNGHAQECQGFVLPAKGQCPAFFGDKALATKQLILLKKQFLCRGQFDGRTGQDSAAEQLKIFSEIGFPKRACKRRTKEKVGQQMHLQKLKQRSGFWTSTNFYLWQHWICNSVRQKWNAKSQHAVRTAGPLGSTSLSYSMKLQGQG